MTVLYDPKRPFLMFLRWRGTIFQSVVSNPAYWLLVILNLTLTILRMTGVIDNTSLPEVSEKFITLIAALLSLLTVFWINSAYNRFVIQIERMTAAGGAIINMVSLAKSTMSAPQPARDHECFKRLQLLARYANLTYHLCYYRVAKYDGWEYLQACQLVTPAERKILENIKAGKKTHVTCAWMLDWADLTYREGFLKAPFKNELIFELRAHTAAIQDYIEYPIPLGYYQLISLVLHTQMLFVCWSSAFWVEAPEDQWLGFLCFVLLCVCFFGLTACAHALIDPWGADDTDVDIATQLDNINRLSKMIINSDFHPDIEGGEADTNYALAYTPPPPKPRTNQPGIVKFLDRYHIDCGIHEPSELAAILQQRHSVQAADHATIFLDISPQSSQSRKKSHANNSMDMVDIAAASGDFFSVAKAKRIPTESETVKEV